MATLKANEYTFVNDKYYFKLMSDKLDNKIYLNIYDINLEFIEKAAYIDYETIKKRLEIKLTKLALVYNSKKMIEDSMYFRYYKMELYHLKSFNIFLELLDSHDITVSILGRV